MTCNLDRFGWRQLSLLLVVVALLFVGCRPADRPYVATFDDAGSWGVGDDADVIGRVIDGRYELLVRADSGIFWATGGENFADGLYEVEATQIEGPLDNGYGMIFRVDNDSFYVLEVSGDGYIWIGRCANGCAEAESLVGEGWIQSPVVKQGLNATNHLSVRAEGPNMIFYVNGEEVGRVTDNTLRRGDIGLMVETLGQGGVKVAFDNFRVTPLE